MPAKRKPSGPEEVLLFLIQHPLRKRLLALCVEAEEARSPKELTLPTNETLSTVGYHVRVLARYGAVELVEAQPRRGSVEHFYEASSLVDEVPWARAAPGLGRRGRVSRKKAKSVRLPDDQMARLEAVARASGKTISEVIRDAVGQYIAELRRDQEFKERLNKRLEEDREVLERLRGS